METTIEGTIFIVPNELTRWKKDHIFFDCNNDVNKTLGLPEIKEGDLHVQVWVFDDNRSDNWSDHGVHIPELFTDKEELEETGGYIDFPDTLDVRLFDGLKEGDTLNLKLRNGVNLKLKLNQLGTRYCYYGGFDTVLKTLIQKKLGWGEVNQ